MTKTIELFVDLEKMSRKQIGQRLRALRLKQGRTLRDVGLRAHPAMCKAQVFRIETGVAPVSVPTLLRLAEGLSVSPSELSDWVCRKRPWRADGEKRLKGVAKAVREMSDKAGKTPAEFAEAVNKAPAPVAVVNFPVIGPASSTDVGHKVRRLVAAGAMLTRNTLKDAMDDLDEGVAKAVNEAPVPVIGSASPSYAEKHLKEVAKVVFPPAADGPKLGDDGDKVLAALDAAFDPQFHGVLDVVALNRQTEIDLHSIARCGRDVLTEVIRSLLHILAANRAKGIAKVDGLKEQLIAHLALMLTKSASKAVGK